MAGESPEADFSGEPDPTPRGNEGAPAALARPTGDDPLLNSLRAPAGWDVTVFSQGPKLGAPAFIKAAAEGELFVSVAESEPGTDSGKILKLMDRDRDGTAEESHQFVPRLDSTRGLEWDGEWLYVMHPPHLSAFRDSDGDHIADQDRRLATGLTSGNGISLGIDGWLYVAIGEGGFGEAKGSDDATLQLHGGGVVRVRPDGTGLHLFSHGVRGISQVAISPTLDIFARGRGNETVGWSERLHFFTGLDHHGYPSLFRNFEEDIIQPLTEFGKGTGAGALFLSEPGFPEEFTDVLLTADSEQGAVFRHRIASSGAALREIAQEKIISAPFPAAIDVDAGGTLYLSGWENGEFEKAGEDGGFVITLRPPAPKLITIPPTPAKSPTSALIQNFQRGAGNSIQVQREILRRNLNETDLDGLETLASHPEAALPAKIASVFTMKLGFGEKANIRLAALATNPDLLPFVLRALGDFPDQKENLQPALFKKALSSEDLRARREAILAVSRLRLTEFIPDLLRLAASDDPVVSHVSINALAKLPEIDSYFEILDDKDQYQAWPAVFRTLARIHGMEVVNRIIAQLEKTDSSLFRAGALKTLARLYHREGERDGAPRESRIDTRGPYLDPVTWEGTAPIDSVLRKALRDKRVNKTFLFGELSRNRIPFDDFKTLLSITAVTPELEEPTVTLLLQQKEPPTDSLPFLTFVATSEDRPGELRLRAATALARSADDMAVASAFRLTLERDQIEGFPQLRDDLNETLLTNPSHEGRHDWLLEEAHGRVDDAGVLAWGILLKLNQLKKFPPEARSEIEAAIDRASSNPAILRRILLVVAEYQLKDREALVRSALDDPDQSVADAAREAADALKLEFNSDAR